MRAKLLFLGTGGSAGVPLITCTCSVCTSKSVFDKRLRPSVLLTVGKKQLIIDVGPDFRSQFLHYGLKDIDAVLLTHTHYDHIGGLDELRIFYLKHNKELPTIVSKDTYEEIRHRMHYIFSGDKAHLDFRILENDFGRIEVEGVPIEYVTYFQGAMKVNGYRLGNMAYISDIRTYDEQLVEALQGKVDILIVSALRYTQSNLHFNVDEAIAFSREIGAKRTFFTHIAHELGHDETNQKLPEDIRLAHDGLEIEFDDGN